MEDIFMKMGMLVVAVAVISVMVAFAFKASSTVPINQDSYEQEFAGEAENLAIMIGKLCATCIAPHTNKDCYLITAKLNSVLDQTKLPEGVVLYPDTPIDTGNHKIKISSLNSECQVKKVG
ncbi:hypothetical protein KY320_03580 [Candidatus Woesearchaeota archaeon]|nr:hypothetical protein [Candidatus Woesearchaeota archaeon]